MIYTIKAKLTEDQYKQDSLSFAKVQAAEVISKEYYYSKYPSLKKALKKKDFLVRLTESSNVNFIELISPLSKAKETAPNISSLDNPSVIKMLLLANGYQEVLFKRTVSYIKTDKLVVSKEKTINVNCSLDKINGDVYYISFSCDISDDQEGISEYLPSILGFYNLKEAELDNRPWLEILEEKNGEY